MVYSLWFECKLKKDILKKAYQAKAENKNDIKEKCKKKNLKDMKRQEKREKREEKKNRNTNRKKKSTNKKKSHTNASMQTV